MREYFYHSPESLDELLKSLEGLKGQEVSLVAGGTDFVPRLSKELNEIPLVEKSPLHIVYLGNMGYQDVKYMDNIITIGALCSLSNIKNNSIIKEKLPVLVDTLSQLAGISIRNIATIGGNIMNASPAADCIPTLLALDAEFELAGLEGKRIVSAKDFFVGPGKTVKKDGEVLINILIKEPNGHAAFKKIGRRKAETLSVVNAAAYIEVENDICMCARFAVGAAAPTTVRCYETEKLLVGKKLTSELVCEASKKVIDEISPIDDIRTSAYYRKRVAPVILSRAIIAACNME